MKNYWKRGQKTALAEAVGLQSPHLYEILHRQRGVGKERALFLEKASSEILEKPIPFMQWLFNKSSRHPAFYGEPINK